MMHVTSKSFQHSFERRNRVSTYRITYDMAAGTDGRGLGVGVAVGSRRVVPGAAEKD